MSPSREPSGRFSTALQAPAILAVVVTSSTRDIVVTLCGMVTSAPCTLVVWNKGRSRSGIVLRLHPDRHHDGVDALASNHGL